MDVEEAIDNPGPGAYEVRRSFSVAAHAAPRVSMSFRPKPYGLQQMPGAADYSPKLDFAKKLPVANIRIRAASQVRNKNEETPGPASYDPICQKQAAPKYSMSGRFGAENGIANPGPGAYCVEKYRSTGPAFSLSWRNVNLGTKYLESVPGAGHYDVKPTRNAMPLITMSSRHKMYMHEDVPGPGKYDPRLSYVKDTPAAMSLSSRVKKGWFNPNGSSRVK